MDKEKLQILQNVHHAAKLFHSVTDICVQIILPSEDKLSPIHDNPCSFCRWLKEIGVSKVDCHAVITQAGKTAATLGGKHFFTCQTGFVHFVSPILWRKQLIATAVGGPVVFDFSAENAALSVLQRFQMPKEYLNEAVKRIINLPACPPEKISKTAELLRMVVFYSAETHPPAASTHFDTFLPYGYFSNIETEFSAAIRAGNKSKLAIGLKNVIEHILTSQSKNQPLAENLCLEFILLLCQIAFDYGSRRNDFYTILYPYLDFLKKDTTLAEIRIRMLKIADLFIDSVFSEPAAKHNDIIARTVDYIRQNYMTKITLESAAAHVYLSPSYLSKIFKDEIGENFNSYLNQVRIENAKRLLLNDNVDLINIATLVGYEDQSYFSKVFKRITGDTPKKYKLSHNNVYN